MAAGAKDGRRSMGALPLWAISRDAMSYGDLPREGTGVSGAVTGQHLGNFTILMLWADGWGFCKPGTIRLMGR